MSLQTKQNLIYIRQHESYLPYNACKLKTTNIPEEIFSMQPVKLNEVFFQMFVVPKTYKLYRKFITLSI